MKENLITALYERLSRDDDLDGESKLHREPECSICKINADEHWIHQLQALYGRRMERRQFRPPRLEKSDCRRGSRKGWT